MAFVKQKIHVHSGNSLSLSVISATATATATKCQPTVIKVMAFITTQPYIAM